MATKKTTAPTALRVWDEYDQHYDIDDRNKLWSKALERHQVGEDKISFPMNDITNALEWGWWSCFKSQEEWVANCGVPMPDHKLLFGLAGANDQTLREMLAQFGGYVSWLETQLGVMEGRRSALKQGYEVAILVFSAGKEKGTEKSKEAVAIAESETLRQTKRMQIETDTLIATVKGMLDGYVRAWETTSRVVTTRTFEAELATRRHA